jgi:Raf kinase inhibitor-like YbhB/YbcL family protein
MRVRQVVSIAAVLAGLGCGATPPPNTIRITTPAFDIGGDIPATYTCSADNESPPFAWDNIPKNAKSLVFLVEDLTARKTNWLVYDIDPTTTGSPEQGVATGGVQGTNDFQKNYYVGPCARDRRVHAYSYRVIALDRKLGLPPGATRKQLDQAMKGHALAQGEIKAKS